MTSDNLHRAAVDIVDIPNNERHLLEPILEESFEGWYQSHAKRTLGGIETVRAALVDGRQVGLVMLNWLNGKAGYVYYIAVLRESRGRGVAGRLLDHSLQDFIGKGAMEVYASVTEEPEAMHLFRSRGFLETRFRELRRKYGAISAVNLYRKMLVVPGEMLLVRER